MSFLFADKLGFIGVVIIIIFLIIALFAPHIAPYDPMESLRDEDGSLKRLEPPSREHIFGTTNRGRDVFSQVIVGTRVAVVVGLIAAFFVTLIGTNFALISGYYGGWVDNLLMRILDILYGIPFLPFCLVLVALLGPSIFNIILAISLFSWRTVARVIRSEVLTLKERPYILAAKGEGASNFRIMYVYILPNVLPLALLEMSLRVAQAIVTEATLSFLGFGAPGVVSWGQTLQLGFMSGAMRHALWWVLPPGIFLSIFVVSFFFASRTIELAVNPKLRRL